VVGDGLSAWRIVGGDLDHRRRRLGEPLLLALHALGFVACGMVWNASRVFHGRKPNLPGLLFGAIVWVGMVLAVPS
jgi:hypothetical protein